MNSVRDNLSSGIHCDYCHKVGGVYLDPANGSVHPNAPGVSSQKVLRPPAGDNIFFGVGLSSLLEKVAKQQEGAMLFSYEMLDPRPFGVVEFDEPL